MTVTASSVQRYADCILLHQLSWLCSGWLMAAQEALPPWHISTITIFDGRIHRLKWLSFQPLMLFFWGFWPFVMVVWKSNASFPTSGRHIRDLRIFHYIGRKGWKMSGLTKAHGPLNSCRIANSNLASHVENHVEPSWFVPLMSLWIAGVAWRMASTDFLFISPV